MVDTGKPRVRVDFSKGNLKQRLPQAALAALQRSGRPVRSLAADLRAYSKSKSLENQRPAALMKIVSRYVTIVPADLRDFIAVLGPGEALRYIEGPTPPQKTWDTLRILMATDQELGQAFYADIIAIMERGARSVWDFWPYIVYYEDLLAERQAAGRRSNQAKSNQTIKAPPGLPVG